MNKNLLFSSLILFFCIKKGTTCSTKMIIYQENSIDFFCASTNIVFKKIKASIAFTRGNSSLVSCFLKYNLIERGVFIVTTPWRSDFISDFITSCIVHGNDYKRHAIRLEWGTFWVNYCRIRTINWLFAKVKLAKSYQIADTSCVGFVQWMTGFACRLTDRCCIKEWNAVRMQRLPENTSLAASVILN